MEKKRDMQVFLFINQKTVIFLLCVLVTQPCPTLQPHGLQPTRLLCPWDSPGKDTGAGCRSLLLCTRASLFLLPSLPAFFPLLLTQPSLLLLLPCTSLQQKGVPSPSIQELKIGPFNLRHDTSMTCFCFCFKSDISKVDENF